VLPVLLFPGLVACDSKHDANDGHDHAAEMTNDQANDEHGDEFSGANFEEGKGIRMSDEAWKSLGLQQLAVSEQPAAFNITISAQVYRSVAESSDAQDGQQSRAFATALVSPEQAARIRVGQSVHYSANGDEANERLGTLWKIERTQMSLLGKAELLLVLPDANHELGVGDFISLKIPVENSNKSVISIPKSALLETSQGYYVFTVSGEFLQRREVKVGSQNDDFVEIVDGLKSGDSIVVKPVDILYLIELKATKGGGHGH
jgi:multidrug efflux pump subunit AcrA (membrane-fusion protein)